MTPALTDGSAPPVVQPIPSCTPEAVASAAVSYIVDYYGGIYAAKGIDLAALEVFTEREMLGMPSSLTAA